MWVPLLINGLLRNLIEETAGLGRGVGLDRGVRGTLQDSWILSLLS